MAHVAEISRTHCVQGLWFTEFPPCEEIFDNIRGSSIPELRIAFDLLNELVHQIRSVGAYGVVTVLQLFKKHGRSGLMEKGDWPKYVDTIRPIYEPEELTAMFGVATEDESDLLKFILGSGLRDQEHRTVEYVDLDFRHDLARVTAKPKWNFTPKNWEERVVPLPHGLMERMKIRMERKKARPHDLVFGNTKGRPDSELDMVVKRVAQRAGLNCGHCITEHGNKCAEGPHCQNSSFTSSGIPSQRITFAMA